MGKKKILVVDDEDILREFLTSALENLDFEVSEAKDGKTGLSLCKEKKPDLILLDIMLPDLLGMQIARTINMSPEEYGIPKIIVLTGVTRSKDVPDNRWNMDGEEAKAQWQSAYRVADLITKPFDFSDLLTSIKRVLALPENL